MIYVLYHGGCTDGFTAAWAAWKRLGNTVAYIPVSYDGKMPEIPDNSVVYLLDFSYNRERLLKMKEKMLKVVVLDHHKTAEAELKDIEGCNFDMNRSGAMMSWDYFHPGIKAPDLVSYVQDRDLWQHKLKDSEEVSAAINSYTFDFGIWNLMAAKPISELVDIGVHVLRAKDIQVDRMCDQVLWVKIGKYSVPASNATTHMSEVAHKLLDMYPDAAFAANYRLMGSAQVVWSLRSRKNTVDVSEVAKQYGGGGHREASGFTSNMNSPTNPLRAFFMEQ